MNLSKLSIKKLFACLAIAATVLMPAIETKASETPRFNFMEKDVKTLRGANRTNGETEWKASVSGKPGDEFRGLAYIHNGILNSTAKNTKVKVTIPAETQNKTATITATISADNAATVTDTMTVTLTEDARLEYMPGFTGWFPTRNSSATTEYPFPNGQTGNEIIANGVNVGDVNGCWEYIQYISFGFRAIPKQFPNITVDKLVKNVTLDEHAFVDKNEARAGDTLEYQINIKNTGAATAGRVVLVDEIPANTSYVVGSTVVIRNGHESNPGDVITGDGIVINDLCANETVTVRFKVKVSDKVSEDCCLVNKARVFFNKVEASDIATTCIKKIVKPVQPPVGPALPVTGAASNVAVTLMTLLAGYFVYSMKMKKLRASTEAVVSSELLGK